MQAVVQRGMEGMIYASRDIFLLDRFPCRMVDIVAWVAGVDHKETTMTVTLDDGDGQHILPSLIRLSPINTSSTSTFTSKSSKPPSTSFATASERRLAKRKAIEEAEEASRSNRSNFNGYPRAFQRRDIRVGDTVRIIGKVDEWMRKKSDGSSEWVRQVVVDENAGGCIAIVDPDAQYTHTFQVIHLHQTLYSRPFVLPDLSIPNKSPPISPRRNTSVSHHDPNMSDSLGMTLTSEAPSELSVIDAEPELRDPTKLRSSQLTDRTFRQYMLDHMSQETIKAIYQASELGQEVLHRELECYFPEYRDIRSSTSQNGHQRYLAKNNTGSGVFTDSTKMNTPPTSMSVDHSTPTQKTYISRRRPNKTNYASSALGLLKPFTPSSILSNERLYTLARLVVDSEVRKEERRRRRRIRDGTATKKDLSVEADRKCKAGSTNGKDSIGCTIDEKERTKKVERLVGWAIRNVSEEGNLVQVTLPSTPTSSSQRYTKRENQDIYGYLPLPSQMLLPLLIPHLLAEREFRKNSIRRKNDFKSLNGMTVDEVTCVMRQWGLEGRWERVGDWNIEDALEYGYGRGLLRKEGVGYWVVDGYEG
ncbi:hypothetical protein I302_105531 [Kwoniella bestiolae CBS 10118]|uniref:Uncharacterized protein n=1 Tax=Kwoniella bestiolae CBS 10118 TaxID=1296100 RepID=A0A1B9FTE8_9TREE|nr:hypothetical protein I302_08814 [Kwoniella bestiolae CBS 10118]OCF22033.1 hypothetical protein I302_08814 [Kwoniella bestiolae CBS 10118]